MYLKGVWLSDFRNFQELSLSIQRRIVLFQGSNAQGKSNLLEGIYYLFCLSSPRTNHPEEMIRHGAGSFTIRAKVEDGQGERELAVHLKPEGRWVWMSGRRVNQPAKEWGRFAAVIFSPEDLSLVSEGDEVRRRFLDQCAVRANPGYRRELARFRRILLQRNRLLRLGKGDQLSQWNSQLAQTWKKICRERLGILIQLNQEIPPLLATVGGAMAVRFAYQPSLLPLEEFLCADLEVRLGERRGEEVRAGCSLYGPHRDRVLIEIGGHNARRFTSRGEKRLLAVSWRLFEAYHLRRILGEFPLMLLDDLFSELDEERRQKVASILREGGQSLITCSDLASIGPLFPEAEVFLIRSGRAQRLGES